MYSSELVKLANIIETADGDVRKMLDEIMEYEEKTAEDYAYIAAANTLLEAFKRANNQMNNYLPHMTEGYLIEQHNGRFEVNGRELTSGNYLELYVTATGQWIIGRVEYNNQYYFYNALMQHPKLQDGMKVKTIA